MKIFTISPVYNPMQGAGVSKVIKSICENLAGRGHQCTILTINAEGTRNAEEEVNSVKVKRLGSPLSKYLYGFSPALYSYITTDGVALLKNQDIIHVHMYHDLLSVESILLLHSFGKPIVFTPHYLGSGTTTFRNFLHMLYRPAVINMLNYTAKIICCSEYEAAVLRKNHSLMIENIDVIAHGIDIEIINQCVKRASCSQHISLLYVGRLVEHKGLQYILNAMQQLKSVHNMQPSLEIVGQGPYKDQLEKMAHTLGVEDNLVWSGHVPMDQVWRRYKDVDIFLLPSRLENFGIVVIEALASGIPSIVANTSSLTAFTSEPGCFGIDYPPDARELADLIMEIHNNDIRVGPFNPAKIRTWNRVTDEYEKLYFDLYKQ